MNPWALVLVAAGQGRRMGGIPKQLRPLGGIPLWRWGVRMAEALYDQGMVQECVLVVPPRRNFGDELLAMRSLPPWAIVEGGAERSDSVLAGLRQTTCPWVLVHDAARPFCSVALCHRLQQKALECGGAVPVLPVTDALKRIEGDAVTPVARENLFVTQTPQAFSRNRLLAVLDGASRLVRDEAEAWLQEGYDLGTVEGERANVKLTYEEDWDMAQRMVDPSAEIRVGHGFDIHPLVPERPLVLAGIAIPSLLGLAGHSDADVVAHAVADALLGAAGHPDIGRLFPASEDQYRGADSMQLLREVLNRLWQEAWVVEWVDITLEAQLPRLGGFCDAMGGALDVLLDPSGKQRCHVKVKSAEHVGALGRGEAMVCHAVALLRRGILEQRLVAGSPSCYTPPKPSGRENHS